MTDVPTRVIAPVPSPAFPIPPTSSPSRQIRRHSSLTSETAADRLVRRLAASNVPSQDTPDGDYNTTNGLYTFGKCIGFGPEKKQFSAPVSICCLLNDCLVVSDCLNHRLQVLGRDGNLEFCIGNNDSDDFNCPHGVCYMPGPKTIAVADEDNHRIVIVNSMGPVGRVMKIIDNGCGSGPKQLNHPTGVTCLHASGHLAVCDSRNNRIHIIDPETQDFIKSFGGPELDFDGPWDICELLHGDLLAVSDRRKDRIQILDVKEGTMVRRIGSLGNGVGEFHGPEGICALRNGYLAVCDSNNHRVVILNPEDGTVVQIIGSGRGCGYGQLNCPSSLCCLSDGSLAVCDLGNDRVIIFVSQ